MQIAIVGLAGSGKTTVFNTLTRGHAETGGYGGLTLNVGVVKVPDERLDTLAEHLQAEEDRPRRRHLRGPAGAAAVDRGPRRDRGAAGRAPGPAARLGRAAPRRARVRGPGQSRTPTGASTRPATSSGSTSSSSSPTSSMVERRLERLQDERPPRHAGRARGERARGGRPRAGSTRASRPARRSATSASTPTRRRRSAGFRFLTQKPVLVLLNVGEGDLAGAPALVARIAGRLRPPPRDRRGAVGQDRDGARRARAGRGGRLHGGARHRRVRPRPGHRPVVPTARADLVPDRRTGRGPRLADPRRLHRGRRGGAPSTPTSRRGSSGPRPSPTRTWSRSARWPRRASTASSAPRARPTASATAT